MAAILYNTITRQIAQLEQDLEKLNNDHSAGQISASLSALSKSLDEVESIARNEITTLKREKALVRASKIREDYTALRTTFEKWKVQYQAKLQEARDNARSELLNRKSSHANGAHSTDPLDQTSETSALLSYLSQESNTLSTSSTNMDRLIQMGSSALSELYDQRSMLKSTQRTLLDVANRLGVSNDLIRRIERRSKEDAWILCGGIVVTVLVMLQEADEHALADPSIAKYSLSVLQISASLSGQSKSPDEKNELPTLKMETAQARSRAVDEHQSPQTFFKQSYPSVSSSFATMLQQAWTIYDYVSLLHSQCIRTSSIAANFLLYAVTILGSIKRPDTK
ncbi:hypothetical protein SmJEL517_g02754 [Synchytrium microbalum]|uniref:Uncharacterized protein n=1 Tax=Synchytrium microbalum TaxID=1806994 RepID=A0A507CB44_9FUNG|nr:uncharacterized protein SmJEL517_g02754 [Synchytrium microbalum]TPX34755.1 hypothetical protein SmJEL517_g02754 [Synchytrium microbalum]